MKQYNDITFVDFKTKLERHLNPLGESKENQSKIELTLRIRNIN